MPAATEKNIFISGNTSSHHAFNSSQMKAALLLGKGFGLAHREAAAMCVCVHSPIMHCNVAVPLLHYPPIILLYKEKQDRWR